MSGDRRLSIFLMLFSWVFVPFCSHAWLHADDSISFNRDVRPILAANCFACHGPDEGARQAELRLDVREAATAENSGRHAIKPREPAASELVRRITSADADERMPPPDSNKRLTAKQIEILQRWIAAGAVYERHWAFVAPRRPSLPAPVATANTAEGKSASPSAWETTPIDRFVLARMGNEGLTPSTAADRYTLIRRVYLDLIGLLPSIEEADAFANDSDPLAYEKLVDRLLSSPQYGERWARKWLDLARYADTNGYEKDRPRNMWPYRDWVIRAMNEDKRFDEFTIEQLAGDMLPNPTLDQQIATGFHRNTMLNEEGGIDPLEFRFHAMTDRVGTTATTWLGLTLNCTQCHSHKYDPITHHEYYQVMALLNNADEPDVDLVTPEAESAYRQQLSEAEKLFDRLPDQWPLKANSKGADEMDRGTPKNSDPKQSGTPRRAAEIAFDEWLARERERTVKWTTLRPVEATSNLPLLTVQADGSIFASGDSSKDDTYELKFRDVPEGTTAIRLEALPDERLPAHGPGMTYYEGPKGDFFLGEFQAFAGERSVTFSEATESYAKNNFGSNPVSAKLATDGDPQTGWSCAGRFGEPHQAVFVLTEPLAASRTEATSDSPSPPTLTIKMRFGRHYACPLGRFRISVTTDSRGAVARDIPADLETDLQLPSEMLTAEQRRRLWEHFLLSAPELEASAKRIRELRQWPASRTALVMRERSVENPRPTFRHHRGEYLQPRDAVLPGVPAFLPPLPATLRPDRLAFARWIVAADQPLTSRVTVNRQWAAFFGQGLVRTSGDFGFQGESPSNPELLDWLAVEFMERGWSLKQLHRMIVTSSVYRQSSRGTSEVFAKDPLNRWLARAPRVRIDAEQVRDVQLCASGLLSQQMFGPPVRPPQPEGVTEVAYGAQSWQASKGEDRYRRGIYTFSKRTAPYALFNTFDAPSGEFCLAQRETSNTPLQSLTLLNDEVFVEAARNLGLRAKMLEGDERTKARFVFRCGVTRPPKPDELETMLRFIHVQRDRLSRGEINAAEIIGASHSKTPSTGPSSSATGDLEHALWTTLARAVLNLDETIMKQ